MDEPSVSSALFFDLVTQSGADRETEMVVFWETVYRTHSINSFYDEPSQDMHNMRSLSTSKRTTTTNPPITVSLRGRGNCSSPDASESHPSDRKPLEGMIWSRPRPVIAF
jgi:hypothetical protein